MTGAMGNGGRRSAVVAIAMSNLLRSRKQNDMVCNLAYVRSPFGPSGILVCRDSGFLQTDAVRRKIVISGDQEKKAKGKCSSVKKRWGVETDLKDFNVVLLLPSNNTAATAALRQGKALGRAYGLRNMEQPLWSASSAVYDLTLNLPIPVVRRTERTDIRYGG